MQWSSKFKNISFREYFGLSLQGCSCIILARMVFIGFAMGIALVAMALVSNGIGSAIFALLLWVLFGFFCGLPPLIDLLSTWGRWRLNEVIAGSVVQVILWVGALWVFEAVGIGDLTIIFVVFCGINGFLMALAKPQEKQYEIKIPQVDYSD